MSVLVVAADHCLVEWKASPFNDMIADSVVAVVLSIEANPHNLKGVGQGVFSRFIHRF